MLPDDIAASHAYLTKLLETCAQLPFNDVARTLRHAFEQERTKGFYAWADFIERLPTYINRHLSSEVQTKLKAQGGLLSSFRSKLIIAEKKPENWPFWAASDRPRILLRQQELTRQLTEVDQAITSGEAIETKKQLARIDCVLANLDGLEQASVLAVNASEIDIQLLLPSRGVDFSVPTCPLTGLQTRGRLRLESAVGGYILYTFKPIGRASFEASYLKRLATSAETLNLPLTDWAGLCRQADELDQKTPVFSGLLEENTETVPSTFSEKRNHFLQLLYLAGGSEYKERNIFIHDDFPLAFAKNAEEFTRILKALISEELIQYDKPNDTPNDWVGGVRTHYHNVLLTREGMRQVKKLREPLSEPIIQIESNQQISSSSPTHSHPTAPMDKRYQVFISSTFVDLQHERLKVQQAVMELDCIPAGMEAFPAIDEEQFEFIKRVIDDCDYYLLIIGGRYGSVSSTGVSYTEMEYDYAVSKGMKAVVLLHKEPGLLPLNKSEQSQVSQKKLEAFRNKVAKGRLVKFWNNADELPGLVASSLAKTIKTYPAVGWVRASSLPSALIPEEHLQKNAPTTSSASISAPRPSLADLHPIIQSASGKLFADGHYRQALLDAYIAVDDAVRQKSRLTGNGTRLMEVAFSPNNPVLKIGDSADEQQGFMALFRGAMLAVRNPKAHSLGGTSDVQRALEWLYFASVLLRNLDDSALQQPNISNQ